MPVMLRRLLPALAVLVLSTVPAHAQVSDEVVTQIVLVVIVLGLAFAIYFIPTWVAFSRQHPNRWVIFVINLVLGGTELGWFGSLIWAAGAVHKSPTGNDGGESGLNIFANDPVVVRIDNPTDITAADSIEKLERLKRLRDSEVITAEEYARLRQPVLDSLTR